MLWIQARPTPRDEALNRKSLTSALLAAGTLLLSAHAQGTPLSVALSSADNVYGIASTGIAPIGGGLDGRGNDYAAALLGTSVSWAGSAFTLGATGTLDAVTSATISLPAGNYATLNLLGTAVNGNQAAQTFTVTYTDGTTSSFKQSLSDWHTPQSYAGETLVLQMPYRISSTGAADNAPFDLYGYSFALNSAKTVKSITLPNNRDVVVLAIDLVPPSGAPTPTATPIFSPVPGSYTSAQAVALSDTTSGALIYYTTNGTTPTTSSAQYVPGTPIAVSSTTTIEAIAVASGYTNSVMASGTYTINAQGGTPVSVALSGADNVYSIASTGSAPKAGGIDGRSNDYAAALLGSSVSWAGSAFTLGATGTLDAVSSATINLPAGDYAALNLLGTAVNGNQAAQSFIVTYTDGTASSFKQSLSDWHTPQSNAGETLVLQMSYRISSTGAVDNALFNLYGYSFALNSAKTVKSITLPNNRDVVVLAIDLVPVSGTPTPAATPTFTPAPGSYTSTQSVTLTDTTPGAVIYYTTNGTTPTTSSAQFSPNTPIPVSTTTTIEALAVASGYTNSAVSSGTYTIAAATPAATPAFSPAPGSYTAAQSVTLTDTTPGAAIFYTTNGTTPTASSAQFSPSTPIPVSTTTTIKALAIASGYTNSAVSSGTYTINAQGGTPLSVSLSSADNLYGIASSGSAPIAGGLDGGGNDYASALLGTSVSWAGSTFTLGATGTLDAVSSATISLPAGNYATLNLLGTGVNGNQAAQTFTVTYTDGTTSSFTQSLSDWHTPQSYAGETLVLQMPYRITSSGAIQNVLIYLYGYSFALNSAKTVQSITLPSNRDVVVLAIDLIGIAAPPPPPPTSPYPNSLLLGGISWNELSKQRYATGSDIWDSTWASDGLVYGVWGDGWGFAGTAKAQIGVSSIAGSPTNPPITGNDVYFGSPSPPQLPCAQKPTVGGKPRGVIGLPNAVMYLFHSTQDLCIDDAWLARSTDNGRTWTDYIGNLQWPDGNGFSPVTILQYGPALAGALMPDATLTPYIYIYGSVKSSPGNQYLARVAASPSNSIETPGNWSYYGGRDASGNPIWTLTSTGAVPVWSDPNDAQSLSISFDPAIGRYIAYNDHGNACGGAPCEREVSLFDAPSPWGPWTTLDYEEEFDNVNCNSNCLGNQVAVGWAMMQQWFSSDGLSIWVEYNSTGVYDSLNFIQGTISLAPGATITGITVSTGTPAVLDVLSLSDPGNLEFIDRPARLTSIPAQYIGNEVIRLAKNDAAVSDASYVSFRTAVGQNVCVAWDPANAVPAWLSSWTNTGASLVGDTTFDVYSTYFPAGNVTLPAANSNVDSYLLFVGC
ncbi:MAG: chitobiase/beta-hexosaminidase C-terminal domain-containing protein [Steroidobacteraceae bacterium]